MVRVEKEAAAPRLRTSSIGGITLPSHLSDHGQVDDMFASLTAQIATGQGKLGKWPTSGCPS